MFRILGIFLSIAVAQQVFADDGAYKVNGKVTSVKELNESGVLYEIEQKKYQTIEKIAEKKFLDEYWEAEAKKQKKSVEAVKNEFNEKNAKVSDSDLKSALAQFKDHPELKKLPKKQQEEQIRQYLGDRNLNGTIKKLLDDAKKSGKLQMLYPLPKEPVYKLVVTDADHVRYGPGNDDIKPQGCNANDCPITIVEYSEFECPYCSRTIPAAKQALKEYKGKIRWVTRDFPLSFHERAKPAAVAAHCAGKQGKYWHMYTKLFENQSKLGDADFAKYAGDIPGLNKKDWEACVKDPKDINDRIVANFETGREVGVEGTPAFFINGRKLGGALPFEEFKRVIEDELKSKKKT